ncbi:ribosome maturation factor RimM [Desulfohalobium retbaense]|jgi:16S rRNA processing protein RimM|uniref:Ribosome maturation factor RimM n=1 Tax=Desulfohalobium retbaense (strain ATCC 49708 / DSM 5692 / JCM 16813 / HR100) TaxID=485915 RepID=C8X433_DESRD|nr:ribosome maturation factor RimM [Desulfohalobium retbaense]ACV69307.1 16S rRNA processing protein RimM [Desulfohalobium retbaense DSM 5692]
MGKIRLVPIGRIAKPLGLRGEVCLEPHADFPFVFASLERIYLQFERRRPKPYAVLSHRVHKGRDVLLLHGIEGRDAAESIRGREVLARARDLPEPDDAVLLRQDLPGCRVELEDGAWVGEVLEVQDNRAQDVWVILGPQGQEILFPVCEAFVLDVDLERRVVVIRPPEGLLDLYLHNGDDTR